jgi:DNA-binding NtrC family response regulator
MEKIRILLIDDDAVIRDGLQRILDGAGYSTDTFFCGQLALEALQKNPYDMVITDLKMPGMNGLEVVRNVKLLQPDLPILIITGYSTVDTAVEAMKGGAADYISKPFSPEEICHKIRSALEHRAILVDDIYLSKELRDNQGFDRFIGHSRAMQKVYRRILQVAPTDSNVLVTGESGTGKELLARAIHNHSPRKSQPFVAVDCTSLAESLLESELFGHIRGSFTGATQTKMGLFKVADGGTLFLDEIANLSLTTQAKLLRVLQEREVTPIGGTRPIPIDIRLVAATNRNLKEMLLEGSFREDLYFRLNIIPIDLPPLRERDGDLPLLTGHFLKTFSEEFGKEIRGLAPNAMALLESYPFPGNVRELENVIERATVLTEGEFIQREDLELATESNTLSGEMEGYIPQSACELKEKKRIIREQAVKPVEKAFVLQALERNSWNVTRAAEETGMLRPNFQALIKKFGISIRGHVVD